MSISSVKTGAIGVSLLAGNAYYLPNDYESIATVTCSGGETSVTFSSIASTWTHLQLRAITKTTSTTNTFDPALVQFNTDTGSNYAYHTLYAVNSTVYATAGASTTSIKAFYSPFNHSNYTNIFGGGVMDILDYANGNKYKTVRCLTGIDSNSSTVDYGLALASGVWMSTSAITSIKINPPSGNWASNTHFALYGIKA